ncbi:SurA N-terminal domain-containing protein [Candidatus Daviesbacteria bacterium]|nr:SurA N-terminal domain-containing protein [Candidatus Daviesbacteria bacterium]
MARKATPSKAVRIKKGKKTETAAKVTKTKTIPSLIQRLKSSIPQNFYKTRGFYGLLGLVGILVIVTLASKYLAVGWVDNTPITRFEYYKSLEQKYGKEVKEQLIVDKLVKSEAQKKGVNVTEQEINGEIKKIEKEQGGTAQLNQILEIQGISQEEFKNLVRLQLLKQKMFGKDIKVTDEEINKYLEENKQSFTPEESTDTAKLKDQIKEQFRQQKINTNFNNWLKDALQSSRVKRS